MYNQEYYYHIYNRGVDKRSVFMSDKDYERFLLSLELFNSQEPILSIRERLSIIEQENDKENFLINTGVEPLVKIVSYCLLPNHFHLLLKQLVDEGISEFMRRIGGYTSYFNLKYSRSGALFQGRYKRKEIIDSYSIMKLICYINGNSEIHRICPVDKWNWNSHFYFIGEKQSKIISSDDIKKYFDSVDDYKDTLKQVISYCKKIKSDSDLIYLD